MYSFDTPDPITVEVRNASGDITIELTDTARTTVDVEVVSSNAFGFLDDITKAFAGNRGPEAGDQADRRSRWWEGPTGSESAGILERVRVDLTQHDDGATLIVDTDPATRGWRTGFTIRISAPTGSGVRVSSQSSDVTVSGTASRLDVRSASGDVVAGGVTGAALLQSASGDMRLDAVGGDLVCRSASGDVHATTVGGAARLHTTSGDVWMQAPAGDVEVRTVSGDVRIADLISGITRITAVSGDVEIGVHPGSLAAVNLTTISGSTHSDFAVTDQPGASRSWSADDTDDTDDAGWDADTDIDIDTDSGDGIVDAQPAAADQPAVLDIAVRTTSGDIRLRRAAVTG
ncbi:MAG TPA: DUF4097 family beta strand repeat-containing protein [Nakamurella sp.]|nr:DUF4097 family beta strand repeat-containing protein [Nakamurella sp.]